MSSSHHNSRYVLSAAGLAVCSLVASLPFHASAVPSLKPSWATSVTNQMPNSSFLARTTLEEARQYDEVIDRQMALNLRQEYEDFSRSYEIRKTYGLLNREEERNRDTQLSQFTQKVLTQVRGYQVKRNLRKVRRAAEGNHYLQQARKPLGLVVAVAAVGTGQPIKFRLLDHMDFTARTDVRSQTGQLQLSSPWLVGTFDFIATAPSERNSYLPVPADPKLREERYRISVSRGVPYLDLNTAVSFATTTSTVTTSVSRGLMPNLSCVVDASRTLNYRPNEGKNGEETIRLQYGLQF